ncbi:cation-translocating P-type ATPase [Thermosulfuriphilus ammonigenes]|uniref:P-type Zn(2+) transporter n=1 Tax=Thermosulfuriphilus ammonigenes TaxID=1936021 RepID=A0A6G7PYB3_9BACT|nr:cation-translocating P-type ATPase [Thermosulfuriphilus ammonigenes]MBA2849363.1 Cd2+/Zn2+-exporting ATPase [Thermosulfuriphilus ammonigenes]QIJ72438.1 cation-translocating P-type ATPase [Thermosulfuriphilus ammonigenes]
MAEEKLFRGPWWQYPPLVAAIVAGIISGAAFVLAHTNLLPPGIEKALYLLAIIIGGLHWMREGLERLLSQGRIDIKILMIGATGGSVALNLWDEAAFLVFLYGAAEGLEEYTYARTRSSIRDLLDLAPKQAVVLRGEREISVPAEEVRQEDVFLVRPGQSLVTDGVILEGESYLDESTVTGESTPVKKGPGDKVFAGTINQTGALKVRATASFEDNTLSRIIHLIEEAQRQKSRTQLFIERFGIWYSPLVLFTSAALAIGALFFSPDPLPWLKRAVVLLVAGAPCALVMSTPIAIAAGIGRAGREGVLIKGGIHLENLGKIKVVAFDKTGTLTLGRPMVTDIVALTEEEELLRLALTLERLSEHPLARAIVAAAEERGLTPLKAEAFKALAGSGVKATVAGKTIYLGRPELMDDLGVDLSHLQEQLSSLRAQGKTIVVVAEEKKPLGLLALRDKVRPKAKEVIRELHHLGIESVMLTGDHLKAARPIAQELGIDEVRAGLSPEDKIRAVEELKRHRGPVAMVGDGVNDAPALAQATVGIAMGAAGTDAAIEAADVALMGDDLGKIVFALKLGRRAREISRENIIFSLLVLMVLIPLALLGAISAAWAVLCHEASELLAVANGLRTSRLKEA